MASEVHPNAKKGGVPDILPPILLGAIVLIVGYLNLSLSMHQGSLAMPPIYDDVGYLLDAYLRLTSERVSSIFETLRSFYLDPPHAPFSTLAAMLGFSLIGPKLAAPYMMGIWPLALYAFAIYLVVRRELSPSVSGLLAVCFLFARAPQLLMSEFRPDIPAGVLFAVAIYLLIFTDYVSMASCAVAGIVAALAIMAKPTAFVATIPVLCAASFIGVVRPFTPAIQDRRMLYRNAAIGVLSALVILMPFGLIWGPSIAGYTYGVLVTDRSVWASDGGVFFHVKYYFIGDGGLKLLGWFLLLGTYAIGADAAFSFRYWRADTRSYNALAYYFILGLIYFGISIISSKAIYFGSFFALPWLLASAIAVSRLLSRKSQFARVATSIALLSVFCLFGTLRSQYQNSRNWPEAAAIANAVLGAIESNPNSCSRPRSIAALTPYPVTVEAIALESMLKGNERLIPIQLFLSGSVEAMNSGAEAADFVLGPNNFGSKIQSNLPGFEFIAQAEERLDKDSKWKRLPLSGLLDPPVLYYKACS